jgi:hypothetical protein
MFSSAGPASTMGYDDSNTVTTIAEFDLEHTMTAWSTHVDVAALTIPPAHFRLPSADVEVASDLAIPSVDITAYCMDAIPSCETVLTAADLADYVVDVGGILLPRTSNAVALSPTSSTTAESTDHTDDLVPVATSARNLRSLALALCTARPVRFRLPCLSCIALGIIHSVCFIVTIQPCHHT